MTPETNDQFLARILLQMSPVLNEQDEARLRAIADGAGPVPVPQDNLTGAEQ